MSKTILVTLTEEELYRLNIWIEPQIKQIEMRGSTIQKTLRFDAQIAHKVWLAWKNHEYIDEQNNTNTAEEHSNRT